MPKHNKNKGNKGKKIEGNNIATPEQPKTEEIKKQLAPATSNAAQKNGVDNNIILPEQPKTQSCPEISNAVQKISEENNIIPEKSETGKIKNEPNPEIINSVCNKNEGNKIIVCEQTKLEEIKNQLIPETSNTVKKNNEDSNSITSEKTEIKNQSNLDTSSTLQTALPEQIKNEPTTETSNTVEKINKESNEEMKDQPKTEILGDVQKTLESKELQLNQQQIKINDLTQTISNLQSDIQVRSDEQDSFKNKINSLELEIAELKKQQLNTLSPALKTEVQKIQKKSEDLLTRAKGIIFDKTKICKNQELQIEALNEQVASLKDVLGITKELLEIRNIEVKHLQDKLECMDMKINAEKQRHDLMHKKMEAIAEMNNTLKEEYQKQLVLFDEMRTRYENENN